MPKAKTQLPIFFSTLCLPSNAVSCNAITCLSANHLFAFQAHQKPAPSSASRRSELQVVKNLRLMAPHRTHYFRLKLHKIVSVPGVRSQNIVAVVV
jgi:hypothetical protein